MATATPSPQPENPPETKSQPKTYDSVTTISEMMNQLQQEINEVKTGVLADAPANRIIKLRGHQLKAAELQIQYTRIFKGRVPDPQMRLTAPASPPSPDPLSDEERKTLDGLMAKAGIQR